ncbi:MAG: hypothetical protein ACRDK9_05860 [Solirubrobacterales bacterium]
MNETVLLLHVLAAFAVGATTVVYLAVAVGAPVDRRAFKIADPIWGIGLIGTLIFGVWLALDDYEITDGWIVGAIVLWLAAGGVGDRSRLGGSDEDAEPVPPVFHWLRAALVVALLFMMIFKPGA